MLDLFSGIGGFSLGLERAGMKTIAFCEMDQNCQKVLKKHWPDVPIFDDVKKLKWSERGTPIDVICGGFPCQDISVAGKKVGIKGERSGLWKEFKRLIKEIEPRYAIIENVPNLRNLGLARVLKDLWALGYDTEWHIISARSIGAPHLRERLWIIAYPKSNGGARDSGDILGEKKKESKIRGPESYGSSTNEISSNTYNLRCWKPFASTEEASRWWSKAAARVGYWEEAQSYICGVDDGVSGKLDKIRRSRVKMLGNSVLPQIPQLIGEAIINYEEKLLQ